MLILNWHILLLPQGHIHIPPLSQLNAISLQILNISQIVYEISVVLNLSGQGTLSIIWVMSPVLANSTLVDRDKHELFWIEESFSNFLWDFLQYTQHLVFFSHDQLEIGGQHVRVNLNFNQTFLNCYGYWVIMKLHSLSLGSQLAHYLLLLLRPHRYHLLNDKFIYLSIHLKGEVFYFY